MKNIILHSVKDKHVFAGIFKFTLCFIFLIKRVDLRTCSGVKLLIHTVHSKAEGHGLTAVVPFSSKNEIATCKIGKLGIPRGIDEIIGKKLNLIGFAPTYYRFYNAVFGFDLGNRSIEKQIYAVFDAHTV